MIARAIVTLTVLAFVAAGCGESDLDGSTQNINSCGREAEVFDEALLADGGTPCLGDTLVLGLEANTDAGAQPKALEFPLQIPHSGRVRLCLDLQDQAHRLALVGAEEREITGPGCLEVDVTPGTRSLRITNGRPAAAEARGHLLFIRPRTDAGEGGAGNAGLLGDYTFSTDCPSCDLRGVDWSGMYMVCDGDSCDTLKKGSSGFLTNGNNFSNALFGGANFTAATFLGVNFRGAQFYDATRGQTVMGTARNVALRTTPTSFDGSDFTGASFQHVDLRQVNFTCFYLGDIGAYLYSGDAILAGADLRDANLAGVLFSPVPHGVTTQPDGFCNVGAGPFAPANLTGAIFNAGTNVTGTDFSTADLSGVDMRTFAWTNAKFRTVTVPGLSGQPPIVMHSIFHHAIFDGIDFTKAPYNNIFVTNGNVNSILAGADLGLASFVGATLTNAVIEYTVLRANFTEANLQSATFVQKDLRGTTFSFADLQKAQLPGVFLGVADEDYTKDPTLAANLSYAYMPGANLAGADLRHANLSYVHLYGTPATVSGAQMGNTSFVGAILSGLDFTAGKLTSTQFQNAQLVGCPFTNADVSSANFESSFLEGTDFTGAKMNSVNLTNSVLSRRGDFGTYTNQVLVYDSVQKVWTCKPSSTSSTTAQNWCGQPKGVWSYKEQSGTTYTVTFDATVLNTTSTSLCPNAQNTSLCSTVGEMTPVAPPYPPVPSCVPTTTNWC